MVESLMTGVLVVVPGMGVVLGMPVAPGIVVVLVEVAADLVPVVDLIEIEMDQVEHVDLEFKINKIQKKNMEK